MDSGHHGIGVRDDGQGNLSRHDEVLGQALRHQLRHGGNHRSHAGIPIRHELGLLLALRRRHLRCAAGDRGTDGVLSRVHLRRLVLFRLGPDGQGDAPARHLPRRVRLESLGGMDTNRQCLDAESRRRRVQPRDDAHGAHELLRSPFQPRGGRKVRAYGRGRLRHRVDVRPRDLLLLSAAAARPALRRTLVCGRGGLRARIGDFRHRPGRRVRLHRGRSAEGKARGDRG